MKIIYTLILMICFTTLSFGQSPIKADESQIKELIIETTDLPENIFDVDLNLDWIKFRFINIKSLSNFKIKSDSWAFEKCKINSKTLSDISELNPNLKKLRILACDVSNDINLSVFKELEEFQLVYSLDEQKVENILKDSNIKKLILSGDVISDPENKKFINTLKQKGVKVEIEGLVI